MTSTSSAAATGLPDRRHFLSTVAGAGALGLPALPALAAAPGPIEAMHSDFVRLAKAYDAAAEATWEAEERYVEPDRPHWRPWEAEGGYRMVRLPNGRCHCYLDDRDENVAKLEAILAEPFMFDPTSAVTELSHKQRIDRARQTLDAIRAWQTEARRRGDAAGLIAAQEAEERARSASHELRDAILAIEANTYRELAFQAAVVTVEWSERRADKILERLAELAGVAPYLA